MKQKKKEVVFSFSGGLMTIDDVCKYLQLHELTVYRLAKKKTIPGFKVGGSWRFSKEAIDQWAYKKMGVMA